MSKEILKTKRLRLRHFMAKDLETLYRYRNDQRCAKYQTWVHKSKPELELFFLELEAKQLGDGWYQLAVTRLVDDQLVGDIFLDFDAHSITIGYTIDYLYHRQGFAFEMLSDLITYLKNNYKQKQLLAKVFKDNTASSNLLLKLGFSLVGTIKKEATDIYSLLIK